MKDNTSENWQEEHEKISKFEIEIANFERAVKAAQLSGDEWVETSARVIEHYNRGGLNGAKFFTMGNPGVKVCEKGTLDAILDDLSTPIGTKIFGKDEKPLLG